MVRGARLAAVVLALTGLVACGSSGEPAEADAGQAEEATDLDSRQGTADETVFDDMLQTEDRARSVGDTVMQDKARTDAAIEAATGDAEPDQDSQP